MSVKQKLFDMRKEVGIIQKQKSGFQFKYADYTAIKGEIDPILEKHKVLVTIDIPNVTDKVIRRTEFSNYKQRSQKDEFKPFTEKSEMEYPIMELKVTLSDLDTSETMELLYPFSFDTTFQNFAQSTGSTYTYMRRYAYMMVFDIEFTDQDPDHIQAQREQKQAIKDKKAEYKEREDIQQRIVGYIDNNITPKRLQEIIKKVANNQKATSKNVTIEQLREVEQQVKLLKEQPERSN